MKKLNHLVFGALVVTTSLTTIWVAGCGGSGGGAGVGGNATGKVALPTGFNLPLSQLQVVSASGTVNLGTSGNFSVPVPSAGPRQVQLVDKSSGKTVLIGYVDSGGSGSAFAGGQGDISARSTADALLFQGLLGAALPPTSWSDFLNDIRGSAQETQVTASVTSALKANPTALTDGDASILSAVGAVQSTFVEPSLVARPTVLAASDEPPVRQATVQRVLVTRGGANGALITVNPTDPQSSLVIEPNPNGDGIVAVSNSRRRGAIFIYKVGSGPAANQITPITPPQETLADIDVEPTEEIHGVITGLVNGLLGKFAYQPLTNAPILLEPDPVQPVAVYDVVTIGPGKTDTIPGVEQQVANGNMQAQAEFDKEWRAALLKSRLRVVFGDILIPILTAMTLGPVEEALVPEDTALEGAMEAAGHSAPGFDAALAAGDLRGAATAVMNAIEHNLGGVRSQVIAALAQSLVSSGKVSAANFQLFIQKFAAVLGFIHTVDKALEVVDITLSFHDNTAFNTADVWIADVLQPIVKIIPQKASVDVSDPLVKLAVTIQNVTDITKFRFKWSNTATEGKLESSSSTANLGTGAIPDSTAVYVTDFTKFQVGQSDTITVQVFNADDLNTPVGTATSTISAAPAPCTTTPPKPVSTGENPPTITFSESSTRPGDILTVTVSYPADPNRDFDLEVTLFSSPFDFTAEQNRQPACQLLTVDGKPAHADVKDIFFETAADSLFNYHVADTTAAQTHVLTFKMLEPTDDTGHSTPYCSSVNGQSSIPPYVVASGQQDSQSSIHPGSTFAFFNENP